MLLWDSIPEGPSESGRSIRCRSRCSFFRPYARFVRRRLRRASRLPYPKAGSPLSSGLHEDLRRAQDHFLAATRTDVPVDLPLGNDHVGRRLVLGMSAGPAQRVILKAAFRLLVVPLVHISSAKKRHTMI